MCLSLLFAHASDFCDFGSWPGHFSDIFVICRGMQSIMGRAVDFMDQNFNMQLLIINIIMKESASCFLDGYVAIDDV